jgi:hypothetical protein
VITPNSALTLNSMVQDFRAILLWGGLAYLIFLVPKPVAMELSKKLRPWYRATALFAVTLAILPFQSAKLGEGWPDA